MNRLITPQGDPIALVAGLRTPFARRSTALRGLDAIELGIRVSTELLASSGIDPALVQRVVYGQVMGSPQAPNIAREMVLGCGLDSRTDAYSVVHGCVTSYQTVVAITQAIQCGEIEVGLAGGADSSSMSPITVSPQLADTVVAFNKARTLKRRLWALRGLRLRHLIPKPPVIKDYTTGLTIADSAEQMAKAYAISREAQDQFTLRSHRLAAQAWRQGQLAEQVMTVYRLQTVETCSQDNTLHPDQDISQLAELPPLCDPDYGTVTAGNSIALTDCAASVLLMSHQRAIGLGLEPLATIRSYAFTGCDPFRTGLSGALYAVPMALERAGLTLADIDLIDVHEASAAQVLATLACWESGHFSRESVGYDSPLGEVDRQRVNVQGGSLAYGHPFAATGARQLLQLAWQLRRIGGGLGLASASAAGGLGAAIVLEVR